MADKVFNLTKKNSCYIVTTFNHKFTHDTLKLIKHVCMSESEKVPKNSN